MRINAPQPIFLYGEEAVAWLHGRDPALGMAMDRIGPIRRPVTPDLFTALVRAIVEQQVATRAAETVWGRLTGRLGLPVAPVYAAAAVEDLAACGLSARKAGWIHEIAARVTDGRLDLSALPALPDGDVVRLLTALPGVGEWTAQMLLLFSLGRPDVVSWHDGAIRRGMEVLYGLPALTRPQFDAIRRRYSPWGSVASLYLWAVAHGG